MRKKYGYKPKAPRVGLFDRLTGKGKHHQNSPPESSVFKKRRTMKTKHKCPVCGKERKNVDALAKHILYIAQSSEIGMGSDRAGKHKRWLEYKGVNVDYESVKSYLEEIKDDVLIFQDC